MPTYEKIIAGALERIATGYVFPDRVPALTAALESRLASGAYETLDGPAFCAAVTADLQQACPDKHLRLLWHDEPQSLEPADEDEGRATFLALLRSQNQGVRRFEHLEGNVGLLRVSRIADAGEGARTIGAAMTLAADTSALILDLRECPGGSPEGAAMWCSYFFPDGEVHLNDIHDHRTGTTRQYWTSAHLPGPRYLDRPVYVLTSAVTFSGGEDVAYTLQAHGRAVVVGERSRGGAHPTARHPVTEHITVAVPHARTVSTVTGANWEGVGVAPDVPVAAEQALDVAHKAALERVGGR